MKLRHSTMQLNFEETVGVALESLAQNTMRTLLTMLGIVIGVDAVICTVAIGQGGSQKVQEQIQNMGENIVFVAAGSVNISGVRMGSNATKTLTVLDAQAIAHGRQGVDKVLLGSVAEEILRLAPCPVLTVGPCDRLGANGGAEIKRILYATTFSPASVSAAAYAISLAQENQSHLDILHVVEAHKTGEPVGPYELKAGCEQRMRSLVPQDADLWCEPNFVVEVGEPAEEILSVAKGRHADVIVLGLKNTSALGTATHLPWTTVHKIISKSECPVLTIRG